MTILKAIEENEEITFYYLQGNHDENFSAAEEQSLPVNLKRFGEEWRSYIREEEGKRLVISGLELTKENADYASHSLSLNLKDFYIVMLHGQNNKM